MSSLLDRASNYSHFISYKLETSILSLCKGLLCLRSRTLPHFSDCSHSAASLPLNSIRNLCCNQWAGTFPDVVTMLRNLSVLYGISGRGYLMISSIRNLGQNRLMGTIPSLSAMTNLRSLCDLLECFLTFLEASSF